MIEIIHVSKNFDDIKAVDDISLTLKENSIIGLIGTNGAGKSTLLPKKAKTTLPPAV